MKKVFVLTAAALLWASASVAAVDANSVAARFVADGYINLDVVAQGSDWLVTALKDGKTVQFLVNGVTGEAVAVDAPATGLKSLAGTGEGSEGDEEGEGDEGSEGDND